MVTVFKTCTESKDESHTLQREMKDSGVFPHKPQAGYPFWTFTNIIYSRDKPTITFCLDSVSHKGTGNLKNCKGKSFRW